LAYFGFRNSQGSYLQGSYTDARDFRPPGKILRVFIDERGLAGKVQVYHFHDWCGEMLRAYHVDLISSQAPIWARQVESVIAAVARGLIPTGQYGALMIDGGHDFELQWLTLVTQMIDPDTNSLLLLYDDTQSIYRRKSIIKFSLARKE